MNGGDIATSTTLAISLNDFCRSVGISRRSFYALASRGEAPPTVKIGRRRVVRNETAAAWLRAREQQ
jgi:predicted DNA-binding transcriptional regulator AlpA